MSQGPHSLKKYPEEAQSGLKFPSKTVFHSECPLDAEHQREKSMYSINKYVVESAGVKSQGEQ